MKPQSTETKRVYSSLASDEDLREIVELFVDEMPARLTKIEAEFFSQNWENLQRTVHQLKGAAGSHGFYEITPVVAHLEQLIRSRADIQEITEAKESLIQLCHCVTSEVP